MKKIVVCLFISLLILQVYSGLGPAFIKNVSGSGAIDNQSQLQSTSVARTSALTQSQSVVANVSSTPTSLANNTDATDYIGPAGIETPLEPPAEPGGKAQGTSAQPPCSEHSALIQQSSNSAPPPATTNSCKTGAFADSQQSDPMSGISDSPISSFDLQEPTGLIRTGTSTALVNTASTGGLTIYVRNVNGNNVAGVRVVLYDVNYNTIGQQYTNSYGYVYWASLNYGTYYDEAYYPSPASLHLEEFWGGDQINVAASSTTSYFTRHTQYVYQIQANGQVIPGTDVEVNPGDNVHIDVTVANKESVAKNVEVTLYLDRDKSSPYDMPPTLRGPVTMPANNNGGGFGWDFSTNNYGSYWAYVVVYGYYNGKYIVTDQYDWLVAFYVRYPDLMWTNIWTNPSSPTGGQSATIYCELKNQGTGNTPITFTNYFYIDGGYDSTGVNYGLAAGAAFDWTFTRTLGPGYHTITASADVNNNVPEANEGNNQLSQKLWWRAPDLIVSNIWWVDSYGNQNPTITSGQPFNIYFTIKNNGDASAGASFAYITVGTVDSGGYNIPSLAPGAIQNCQLLNVVVSSAPNNVVTVTADYQNNVAEANQNTGSGIGTGESNNQMTATVPIQKAQWTVIAFLAADNNLESAEIADFNQLAQTGSTAALSIAVQMDRNGRYDTSYGGWTDTKRFYISKGITPAASNALQDLGELDTGNSQTLSDFADWAIDTYQAAHYLLVIDDHGGSWVGCAWDYGNTLNAQTHLFISGMASAFSTINSHLGRHLDIVWFDACLMSSIEVAYQTSNYADYLVGSETVGWTQTWNYNTVISYLTGNPTVNSQSFAIQIVNLGNPVDEATNVTQSISAIDLSKIPSLVTTTNNLAQLMESHMHAWQPQIQNARAATNWFVGPYSNQIQSIVDLEQLCSYLTSSLSDNTAKSLAQSIMNQIGPHHGGVGYVVMIEKDSPIASFCNGISIYFPNVNSIYDSSYPAGNYFAADTQWDEFLTQYYNPSNAAPIVTITSPLAGVAWSGARTVTWTGSDNDYDTVTYNVYVSIDGGTSWHLLTTVSFSENPTPSTHITQLDTTQYSDSADCIIKISCNDNWGGTGTVSSSTFTIDNTAPVTGIVHFAGSVSISIIANDATSGVYASYHRIDGGAWNIYTSAFTLSLGTTHLIESYSTDNAGNTGPTVHLTVYYLTISTNYGSVSPGNGWYDSGTSVQIGSTANGYTWNGWTGSGTGSYTGTNNPATITMNGAISETASWIAPPPPGSLSGTVTDSQTSASISGATVSYTGPTSGSTTTDSNGYYAVSSLVPGSYAITVSMINYYSQTQTATVNSGAVTTVNFQLQPLPGSITGRVTDSTNSNAIFGATVSYSGPNSGTVPTDSNGYYTIQNLLLGSYQITASMSGYMSSSPSSVSIPPGGSATINFQLQPLPGSITGRVTDSLNGNAVSGATVSYSGAISGSVAADSNGYYTIPNAPEGSYQLTASMFGYTTSSPASAFVPPGGSVTIDFQLQQSSMYTLTFYTDPSSSGSITCGGSTYSNGQTGQYAAGTYSVSANAPSGYAFSSWVTSGGVSISGSTATVTGAGSVQAVFVPSSSLFSDGFEEGSIAIPPWSGQSSAGTVLAVQSSIEHSGSCALQVSGLGSVGDYGFAYYGLSGTEFTASEWYMFNETLPTATGSYWILTPRFASTAGTAYLVADPIYNFATQKFGIRYWGTTGVVTAYETGTSPISAGVWYQLTLYMKSAVAGTITLWVSGSSKLTVNANTNTRPIGYACCGANYLQTSESKDRVTLLDDFQVNAGYVPPPSPTAYDVTFLTDPSTYGAIVFNGNTYTNGQIGQYPAGSYTVTANTPAGYSFGGWVTTGGVSIAGSTATVTAAGSLKAIFTPAATYTVTFNTVPSTSGSITCAGYTYTNGQTGQYAAGTYPLSANVPSGYAFSNWVTTGGASVSGSTATVTGVGSVEAVFVPSSSLFSDGFEEGSIAIPPWSGQTSTGTTISVQNSIKHSGSYALQVSGLGATGDYGFAYYSLSGTEFTASEWYMFNGALPTASGSYWILTPRFASTSGPAFLVADPIYNFATQKFGIRYWGTSGVSIVYEAGTSPISAGVWYQVTLYIKSANNGIITLWVGGSSKLTVNANTNTRTIGSVCCGGNYLQVAEALDRTILVDDFQVNVGYAPPNITTYAITFLTDPATVGSITFGGTTYSNGSIEQYAAGTYSVSANAPSGYAFSSWVTSGGVSISGSTATVTGAGSVQAVFVPSSSLFSDGFEGGSIAIPPWSGQTSTGTTISVQNSIKHGGSYAMQVSGLGSVGDYGFVYYGLSGTEFTASEWYMFNETLPTATGSYWILTPRFASTAGPAYLVADPIYNFATQKFGIRYWGPSGVVIVYESGTSPISAGTWYQLTLYIKSAANGTITLWVSGSAKLTVNANTATRTIGYVCCGANYLQTNESQDRVILIDDFTVNVGYAPP